MLNTINIRTMRTHVYVDTKLNIPCSRVTSSLYKIFAHLISEGNKKKKKKSMRIARYFPSTGQITVGNCEQFGKQFEYFDTNKDVYLWGAKRGQDELRNGKFINTHVVDVRLSLIVVVVEK